MMTSQKAHQERQDEFKPKEPKFVVRRSQSKLHKHRQTQSLRCGQHFIGVMSIFVLVARRRRSRSRGGCFCCCCGGGWLWWLCCVFCLGHQQRVDAVSQQIVM